MFMEWTLCVCVDSVPYTTIMLMLKLLKYNVY